MATHFSLYSAPYKGVYKPVQNKAPEERRATQNIIAYLFAMTLLFEISTHAQDKM